MKTRVVNPIPIATVDDPVGATVGAGDRTTVVGCTGAAVALPVAATVIVCVQLLELLTPLALSVKIADAWKVPELL